VLLAALKPQRGGRTGAQRRSFFRLANKTEGRQNNDLRVSLSLQLRAAAAVLTPGVECVALKELRALRARILPSNRLPDALDLSRMKVKRSQSLSVLIFVFLALILVQNSVRSSNMWALLKHF